VDSGTKFVESETPEERGFRKGKHYAASRDKATGGVVKEAGLSRIHAYLFKGNQPRVVAKIKADLDWAEFNFWIAITGIPQPELAQFWLIEMKERIDDLAGFCNIPDLLIDQTISAYEAIVTGSGPMNLPSLGDE